MLTSYSDLRRFLDGNNHLHEILSKLGKTFDSNDFITAFRLIYPDEYADAAKFAGTFGRLHSWIARWYLSQCKQIKDLGLSQKPRIGINGNPTRNHRWSKL